MKPNAAQYRRLLTDILANADQTDPTFNERQILISCVLTMADTITVLEQKVAKLEKMMGTAVGPALKKLLSNPAPEAETPEAVEGDEETPLATATIAGAQPATVNAGAAPTAPVSAGAHLKSGGSLVTTSAPAPLPKQAQP